jgi:type VI secretion system protein ImpM
MRFGLFGKLQAKRDFIAVATPRSFLAAWEPWLQGGISASRQRLGDRWQNAFLTAPIWRFWLGADICGVTTMGALMPSMDGVGRYFPLTFLAFAEAGEGPPPPEIDPADGWFAAVEAFLFTTLEPGRGFEELTDALAALPAPPPPPPPPEGVAGVAPYAGVVAAGEDGFSRLFESARRADGAGACAAMSFWWTAGGQDYPPRAIATPGLPDPQLFAAMLTGDFAAVAAVSEDAG